MEEFVKGDVVVVRFPFSDLKGAKRRPALVLTDRIGNDYVLAQITSVERSDEYAVSLGSKDFSKGELPKASTIRVNKLFTADQTIIQSQVGSISNKKKNQLNKNLKKMFGV